jgi:S-adenosylmethionine:tRNA ribosyltransferase-isomerase
MNAKELGIDIYCVGTTSLRTIETAYLTNNLAGKTDYFIFPDTKINIPDYLITNFHAPKSSLLSIVSAIYGNEWTELYKHALESGIKFLSFGDAVLFEVNE